MFKTITQLFMVGTAVVAVGLLVVPVNAALIVTDTVEDSGDYTYVGLGGTTSGATLGLSPLALTMMVTQSSGGTTANVGTVTKTTGFGGGVLLEAGTYTLSANAGQGREDQNGDFAKGRFSYDTFDAFLQTIGGTELTNKTAIQAYVDPNSSETAVWSETLVQYEIDALSPLIGQQFTWGFDYTIGGTGGTGGFANNNRSRGFFDDVSVDFVAAPVPEPSSLAIWTMTLLGLALYGWSRRGK